MKRDPRGFLALFTAATLFSVFTIFIRTLNQYMIPNQQVALRGLTGFLLSAFLVVILKRNLKSLKQISKRFLLLYAFSFPMTIVLFTTAVTQTSITATTAVFYIGTLITSLVLGVAIYKEKLTANKLLSLGLVIVGVGLLLLPLNLAELNIGLVLGLLAGIIDAATNAIRKFFSGKIDRLVLTSLQMAAIFLLGAFLTTINGQVVIPNIPLEVWILGIFYGASIMCVSLLLLYGFGRFDLNLGTIVLSSELFIAPLLGIIAFAEQPTTRELAAAFFVFLAVVVVELRLKRRKA